jgi:hypothetical protein
MKKILKVNFKIVIVSKFLRFFPGLSGALAFPFNSTKVQNIFDLQAFFQSIFVPFLRFLALVK